jgi:hypothetical protein
VQGDPGWNSSGSRPDPDLSGRASTNKDMPVNDNLFSHPTEAQAEAKTEENTSAEPVTMPVFSHQDR